MFLFQKNYTNNVPGYIYVIYLFSKCMLYNLSNRLKLLISNILKYKKVLLTKSYTMYGNNIFKKNGKTIKIKPNI